MREKEEKEEELHPRVLETISARVEKIQCIFLLKCNAACKSNRKNNWSHVAVVIVFGLPKLHSY